MMNRVWRIAVITLILITMHSALSIIAQTVWECYPVRPHSFITSHCCSMVHGDDGKCIKCDGSKKCQVCWGSGKNSSDQKCSICDGSGKCYYCGGTGKS
jgi:hypothetical protein